MFVSIQNPDALRRVLADLSSAILYNLPIVVVLDSPEHQAVEELLEQLGGEGW